MLTYNFKVCYIIEKNTLKLLEKNMKLIDTISYDTEFTLPEGIYKYYVHGTPCIGLAISKNRDPIIFILSDHELIKKDGKTLKFYTNEESSGLTIQNKGLNWEEVNERWHSESLLSILEDKENIIEEVLDYEINNNKFDFVKTLLETNKNITVVNVVIKDIENFNNQLESYMEDILKDVEDKSITEVEMRILLDSNNLNYFDICNIVGWLEDNPFLDTRNFPINADKIEIFEAELTN